MPQQTNREPFPGRRSARLLLRTWPDNPQLTQAVALEKARDIEKRVLEDIARGVVDNGIRRQGNVVRVAMGSYVIPCVAGCQRLLLDDNCCAFPSKLPPRGHVLTMAA